jgi:GNAT superfamily N-acetyltransferase
MNTNTNMVAGSLAQTIANEEYAKHMRRLRHDNGWFFTMHEFGRHGEMGLTTLVILAIENGVVVGQMLVDAQKRCGVFVDPLYRRRGVGTSLMHHAHCLVGNGMSCCPDDEGGVRFFKEHELSLGLLINNALIA